MGKVLGAAAAAALMVGVAAPAVASAPPVKHARLDDDQYVFIPGTLHVKKGTKVIWKWFDGTDQKHNIYVLHGPVKFHSRTIAKGTFSHVFTKPGTYHLYCKLHTFMTETVVVK
jgi:plastocyanin